MESCTYGIDLEVSPESFFPNTASKVTSKPIQCDAGPCTAVLSHSLEPKAMPEKPPIVLTIAGFDPSSGAGVTADIKTIAAHACYGVACITALTVQSSSGVRRVEPVAEGLVREILEELAGDLDLGAVHIGMLGNGKVVRVVADFLAAHRPPAVVLDPVLRSSSGTELLDPLGVRLLTERLLPLATAITPNLDEAAQLTGIEVTNLEQMRAAAARLHALGAAAV